jgi:hypothetical protein
VNLEAFSLGRLGKHVVEVDKRPAAGALVAPDGCRAELERLAGPQAAQLG